MEEEEWLRRAALYASSRELPLPTEAAGAAAARGEHQTGSTLWISRSCQLNRLLARSQRVGIRLTQQDFYRASAERLIEQLHLRESA